MEDEPKVIFCPEHTYGLEGCTYCATHDTTRPQPENIMKLKDLRVGSWYAFCCELDLKQVESEKELQEIREEIKEDFEDGIGSEEQGLYTGFWSTKEEALKELRNTK